jgi:DNA helicase II / ATP-dependent DNA helicase PcrA
MNGGVQMSWSTGLVEDSPAYVFASSDAPVLRSIAGPGAGKSFALRRRIARLLEEGVDPKSILAVTFTRTAAADLKKEIESLNVPGASDVEAKTLHSLCFQILCRREILEITGRTPRILLQHELKTMLKDLNNINFGSMRDKEKRVRAYVSAWARLQCDDPGYAQNEIDASFENELINWLTYHKAMLIGEIIPQTLMYLRENPECPERATFKHVLVDEFRDLNKAEQELIKLIKGNGSLVIIGDDDQSIYSFKYAHPDGIRQIPSVYDNCITITFNECRRCPTNVVRMASNLIRNNRNRTLGDILPRQQNSEGIVKVLQWTSLDDEIDGVCNIIKNSIQTGSIQPSDVLVLTPRRVVGYRIRDLLNTYGIKAKSNFREESLDSDKTKYKFSLLNIITEPNDEVALRFLLGFGSEETRSRQYNLLKARAEALGCTIRELLEKIILGTESSTKVGNIINQYKIISEDINQALELLSTNINEFIDFICPETDNDFVELREIIALSIESIGLCSSEEEVPAWLKKLFSEISEKVSMPDSLTDVDYVRIMSLHASKGLSAKYVVLTKCVEGLIPKMDGSLSSYEQVESIEEQRRLFYVALTRCKNEPGVYQGTLILNSCVSMHGVDALKLGLSASAGRPKQLIASRFPRELGSMRPNAERGLEYVNRLGL